MTLEDTLRYIATQYLFAIANSADHFGAATRECFGAFGIYLKPRPKKRLPKPPRVPTWIQEHREVEERTWPNS